MALFKNKAQQANLSEHAVLTNKYNSSRNNLLLVVAFTVINLVLLLTGSTTYFLFSASIPYYLPFFGMIYTGKMPAEYYEGWADFQPYPTTILTVLTVIAVILIAVYLLCWLLSKKHGFGWLVVSLVCFIADTIFMFVALQITSDMILNIVFHAWVIISLFSGVSASVKLKKLPPEEQNPVVYDGGVPDMASLPTINETAPVTANEQPAELPQEPVNEIPEEE